MLHSGFLFGLFFGLEAGGDTFLRNVSCISTNYTVYIPECRTLLGDYTVLHSIRFIYLIFSHCDEMSVQKNMRHCYVKQYAMVKQYVYLV
jgi:hypothetical protein